MVATRISYFVAKACYLAGTGIIRLGWSSSGVKPTSYSCLLRHLFLPLRNHQGGESHAVSIKVASSEMWVEAVRF